MIDDKKSTILQWLSAPDPSSNYNAACKKRLLHTGDWLLNSSSYFQWKANPRSFLWLHGIPGCGKTVLSSTVIHDLMQNRGDMMEFAIAYFYFDFQSHEKQSSENLWLSLVRQLSCHNPAIFSLLRDLYDRCSQGQQRPTHDDLMATLHNMVQDAPEAYIIIDALDECIHRDDLLEGLEEMYSWELENLHLLVASRKEIDIEDSLSTLVTSQIALQDAEANEDIDSYIRGRLKTDTKLTKWSAEVRKEIELALTEGANGM